MGRTMRPLDLLFLTQTYPRFPGDTAGPFIRDLARGLVRGGDRVTVLAPHARGGGGGLGRRRRRGPHLPLRARAPRDAGLRPQRSRPTSGSREARRSRRRSTPWACCGRSRRQLAERRYDLVHAHWIVPNGLIAAFGAGAPADPPLAIGLHGSDVFLAEKPPSARSPPPARPLPAAHRLLAEPVALVPAARPPGSGRPGAGRSDSRRALAGHPLRRRSSPPSRPIRAGGRSGGSASGCRRTSRSSWASGGWRPRRGSRC